VDSSRAQLVQLEAIAFRAWPASEVVCHRGMLLRASGGDSRRARSAALHACEPALSNEEVIAATEAFYCARGMPPQLQIGPLAPVGLDAALAARGYASVSPALVQLAEVEDIRRVPRPPSGVVAEVHAEPDAVWIEIEVTRGRYASIADEFLRVMRGLGRRAGFGVARVDGAPAAAALFVVDGDVTVIAAMRTVDEMRRRGAARTLLATSAQWAAARGASRALLQVDRDNNPALALYRAAGFTTHNGYHYRVAD
jgi:ribosomal protein S18 acetylase RimI-like enzyme